MASQALRAAGRRRFGGPACLSPGTHPRPLSTRSDSGANTSGTRARRVYLAYRLGAGLLRAVPPRLATGLGELGGLLAAAGSAEGRRVVSENLAHVVGPVGDRELRRLVRRAFADYGRYWADVASLDPGSPRVLAKRWHLEGAEHLRKEMASGRGAVLALPHLGSWEVGGMWLASSGFPFTTVVEPLNPPELHEWFAAQRRRLGITVLPLGPGTASTLVAELRAGGLVALLADRDLTGDGVEATLFGARSTLPAGPAVLALRTGAALLPCAVYHEPHGHHRGVIRPPIDTSRSGRLRADVARVTATLAGEIEDLIRVAPEQWHAFQPAWPGPPAYRPEGSAPADGGAAARRRTVGT